MAEPENLRYLKCKICLDFYKNPKNLRCGHSYCKNCLDNNLIFREDGSAEISCPLKCKSSMLIGKLETTSSLPTNYALSQIVEDVKSNSVKTCGSKVCEHCQDVHPCEKKEFTAVSFDEKLSQFQPLCREHDSSAKEICIECDNIFICSYCKHREHNNHERKSIADMGKEAQDWFQSFAASHEEKVSLLTNLKRKYCEVMVKIKDNRENLIHQLELRRLKRVEQFIEMLNIKKQNMIKQFDDKVEEFNAKITDLDSTEKNNMKKFSNYINTLSSKSPFELVAAKVEHDRRRLDIFLSPPSVLCLHSQLYISKEQNMFVNPLGEIKISIEEADVSYLNSDENCVYINRATESKVDLNHLELERNLTEFIEYLQRYEKHSSKVDDFQRIKRNTMSDCIISNVESPYQFEELRKIIENGDVAVLQTFLKHDEDIVKMKDNFGCTLLILAARYNKPSMVEFLIEAGSDVYAENVTRWNAYHYSACYGHQYILQTLINHDDTNINNVNNDGNTPLHYASQNGHAECVKLFLNIPHIDLEIKNDCNQTASETTDNDTIKIILTNYQKLKK
ncbi:E3 ubiquitin-protein ligase TRIM69-like isoform X2 [Hydractinia symbiolongicarpus]|uniref:E3 ubiquitin-protein ligase TRIM69-like isoform X2 n=1 Tax=Hydractinia symbiolongicarpus TaxID=13093 RepID=UPI00254FFB01|nr:E3 ubiquitin-protein ligase TRIM69-like isoform X2 [Hydractinia symbiolongicarpus]